MNVYLLLPAYNEALALQHLLPRALDVEPKLHIMVVDDGSTDATAEVVRSFPTVRLVQHQANRGLGEAFRTLFQTALQEAQDEDVLVTMDADNSMDPALIPIMLEALGSGADIVIASRFSGGQEIGVPLRRRLYSRMARVTMSTLFAMEGVRDYTCGYRMYRVSLIRQLAARTPRLIDASGFTSTVELLLNLAPFKPKVREIPLELRYDQKQGKSKMRVFKTMRQYLTMLVKHRLSRDYHLPPSQPPKD